MKKDSRIPITVQMMIHCGMGATLGALLGLALILTDQSIFRFIVSSTSPLIDMAVFVGFFSFIVGTSATISDLFFTVIEQDSLKATAQAKRVNQWRGLDKRD